MNRLDKVQELVNDAKSNLEWHKSRVEEFEIKHELYLKEYNVELNKTLNYGN
tara:strand:+ start:1060 stop:1215 length:156 start_codon:yes stop_codon:yes gene_type:complete